MNSTQPAGGSGAAPAALPRSGSSSLWEALGAIAAMVLAIVGLSHVLPAMVAAVATIIIGAGLLLEGGGAGAQYRQVLSQGAAEPGGMTADFLGGLAGIVLGILALFGIAAGTLLSVAVIIFGASVLLSGAAGSHLNWLFGVEAGAPESSTHRPGSLGGGQVLVGLAAVVLGILAVIGIAQMVLVLVGLLALGAGGLFGGDRTLRPARP